MVGGTNVELGPRGFKLNTRQVLKLGFSHLECGFYGRIVLPSLIKVGDEVAFLPNSIRTGESIVADSAFHLDFFLFGLLGRFLRRLRHLVCHKRWHFTAFDLRLI